MEKVRICKHEQKHSNGATEICKDCNTIVSKYVTVKRGKVRRSIEYEEDIHGHGYISAIERVFPLSGYSNQYVTTHEIREPHGKYSNTRIYCENYTWACRGHGMTDTWTEAEGYTDGGKYHELKEKLMALDEEDYDGIIEVYNCIREVVNESCDYEDSDYYEE